MAAISPLHFMVLIVLATAEGPMYMRRSLPLEPVERPSFLQLGSGVHPCSKRANRRCTRERRVGSTARIAVYTYNLGGYEEPRDFQVPCVPPEVDAFLFLDSITKRKATKASLAHWKRQGWQLKMVNLKSASRYVSGERLTSKYLKFTPPNWMENYDWLIGYDHDMTIDLGKLPQFLEEWQEKPLLMLKWYWRDCDEDAFKCMMWEMNDMLTKRPEYVRSSRQNIKHWKEMMRALYSAQRPFRPPHYFESCILARNLKHPAAEKVKMAFEKTYNMSHDIQRDQFLLPYYLWFEGLSHELQAMQLWEMQEYLNMCSVPTKRKRN